MQNLSYERSVLKQLSLPTRLIEYIEKGTLQAKIDEAYATLKRLNEQCEAFEREQPALAAKAPWAEQWTAWKADGCPTPPWYEALMVLEPKAPKQYLLNVTKWPLYITVESRRERARNYMREKRKAKA